MIKAIIVEDEAVAARRMKKLLEEQGVEVLGVIYSNKELTKTIELGNNADVYFMDINLSDGIVFEVLQKVKLNTPIIFTTAYDQYAIKAFKQNSVDYLLKPIAPDDLKTAIDKFKSVHQKSPGLDYDLLSQLINKQQSQYRERIKVKVGDKLRSFKMSEISLIYTSDKITFLQTHEGRSYPIDLTIDNIVSDLDPSVFHRVNRGQVVHIDHISDVVSFSNSRLKVLIPHTKDQEVIVARDRVKLFKEWFG